LNWGRIRPSARPYLDEIKDRASQLPLGKKREKILNTVHQVIMKELNKDYSEEWY
jgi:hypothetical protein